MYVSALIGAGWIAWFGIAVVMLAVWWLLLLLLARRLPPGLAQGPRQLHA